MSWSPIATASLNRGYEKVARASLVIAAGTMFLMGSCSNPPEMVLQYPWTCYRVDQERVHYACADLNITWAQWASQNKGELAVAYMCVTQYYDPDPESNTQDFICKPMPSQAANAFEDGTIPRFHCFGTHDDSDLKTEPFHCTPYWEVTDAARRRLGSGWFLWLALQEQGSVRAGLMTVAEGLAREQGERVAEEVRRLEQPTSQSTPNNDATEKSRVQEAPARNAPGKSISTEEAQRRVATEVDRWRQGFHDAGR